MNILPFATTKPLSTDNSKHIQSKILQDPLVTPSREQPATFPAKPSTALFEPAVGQRSKLNLAKALQMSRARRVAADIQALVRKIEQKDGQFAALLSQLQVWLDAVNTESDVIKRHLKSIKPFSSAEEVTAKKDLALKAALEAEKIADEAEEKAQADSGEEVDSYRIAIQQGSIQAAAGAISISIIASEKTAKAEKNKVTKSDSRDEANAHADAAERAARAAEDNLSHLQNLAADAPLEYTRTLVTEAQNAAVNARENANEARDLASSITDILESRSDFPSLKLDLTAISNFARSIQTHKQAFLDSPKGSKKNEFHRSLMIASQSRASIAASTIQNLARRDQDNSQINSLNRNTQFWLSALNQELQETLQIFADRNGVFADRGDEKAAEKIKEQLNPDNSLPKAATPEDESAQKGIEEYSPTLRGLLQRDKLRLAEQKTKSDTKAPLSEDKRAIIRQKLACIIEFEKTIKTKSQTLLETQEDGAKEALATLLGSTKVRAQLAAIKIQSIVDEHQEDIEARDIRNEAQALITRIRTQVADTLKIVADRLAVPEKSLLQEEQQKALKKAKNQLARIQAYETRANAENTQVLQHAGNTSFFQIIQNNATEANRAATDAQDELNAMEQELLANPSFTPASDSEFSAQLTSLLEQARSLANRAQAAANSAQQTALAMKKQIVTDNKAMAQEKLISLKEISAKVKEHKLREPLLITKTKAALTNLAVLMESMRSRSNLIQTRVSGFLTIDPADDEMQRMDAEAHALADEINEQINGILNKAADLLHESTVKRTVKLETVELAPPAYQQEAQAPFPTPENIELIRARLLNEPDTLENPAPCEVVEQKLAEIRKARSEIKDWQQAVTHVEEIAAELIEESTTEDEESNITEREQFVRETSIEAIKSEVEKAKAAANTINVISHHNKHNDAIKHFNEIAQAELIRLIDRQAVSEKIVATQTASRIIAPEYAPQIQRLETQLARLQELEQDAEQERNRINQTNSSMGICLSADRALRYAEEAESLLDRMERLGGLFDFLRMKNILADARASVQKTRLYAEQAQRQAAIRLLTETVDEKGDLYPPKKDDRPDDDPSAGAAGALITTDERGDDTYLLATRIQGGLKTQKRSQYKISPIRRKFHNSLYRAIKLDTVSETAENLADNLLEDLTGAAGGQNEEKLTSLALDLKWQQLNRNLAKSLAELTLAAAQIQSYSKSLISTELAPLMLDFRYPLCPEPTPLPEGVLPFDLTQWFQAFYQSDRVSLNALQNMASGTLNAAEVPRFQQMTADEKKAFMAEKNMKKVVSCLIQWLLRQTNLQQSGVNLDLLCTALEANAELVYELILAEIEVRKSAAAKKE